MNDNVLYTVGMLYIMDEKLSLYLEKAQRYCSMGEQCVHSLGKKMREWGVEPDEAEYIIGELIVGGYLNEERYAKAFVRGKFKMLKWGRRKIVYHLKMNNISSININIALREIDEEVYDEVLATLLLNKWNETKGNIYFRKAKVMNYLLAKGYETDLILDKLNEIVNNKNTK